MGVETIHMSNMFALNNGCALRVIVRPMALSSSACTSIEAITSKHKALR